MNRLLLPLLVAFCLVAVGSTRAAVFERDWKTPGDGLLTFDDVNQREWLDPSVTLLEQFSGTTLEDRYQDAISEIAPGGMFEGFSVGKRLDVIALAESAGIDTSSSDFALNQAATTSLINVLGRTATFGNGGISSMRFVADFFTRTPPYRVISVFDVNPPRTSFLGSAGLFDGGLILDSAGPPTVGLMLFRQVAEPSSFVLALAALHGRFLIVRNISSDF